MRSARSYARLRRPSDLDENGLDRKDSCLRASGNVEFREDLARCSPTADISPRLTLWVFRTSSGSLEGVDGHVAGSR
jgi:hypothetical protein